MVRNRRSISLGGIHGTGSCRILMNLSSPFSIVIFYCRFMTFFWQFLDVKASAFRFMSLGLYIFWSELCRILARLNQFWLKINCFRRDLPTINGSGLGVWRLTSLDIHDILKCQKQFGSRKNFLKNYIFAPKFFIITIKPLNYFKITI